MMDNLGDGHGFIAVAVGSLTYSINHVFLPPKTPGTDDMDIDHERDLVKFLLCSIREFSDESPATEPAQLGRAARMLERLLTMQPGSELRDKKTVMAKVIRDLERGGMLPFPLFLFLSLEISFSRSAGHSVGRMI